MPCVSLDKDSGNSRKPFQGFQAISTNQEDIL